MANSRRPIKVMQFICPTGFYGAERWILALLNHLDPDEVQSTLAVTLESDSRNLKLVKEVRQRQLGEVVELPMAHRFDLRVIDRLVSYIKDHGIDLIHTHGYKSDIIGLLAARRAGIQCVSTPHGFENAKDLKLRLFIRLGCMAMSRADVIAPLSEALMDDCRKLGVKEHKLRFIRNGVDLSEVHEERKKPVKANDKKQIGFIGQLISRKNVDDILLVFDSLHRERDDIELLLIGDGEERGRLEALADGLRSRQDIHFLGFRDDRLALLHSLNLFVMTSTLEGIPRCLMEASAMGVPLAAYDIPGVDQIIEHDRTGLLAAPGDRESLLAHWRAILDDDALAQRLSSGAEQLVNEKYAAARMAREYTELFGEVCPEQNLNASTAKIGKGTFDAD